MRSILILLLTSGAVGADDKGKAVQTAAFCISTAFHCQRVISSEPDYQQAITTGKLNLVRADYSEKEAINVIASITSKLD